MPILVEEEEEEDFTWSCLSMVEIFRERKNSLFIHDFHIKLILMTKIIFQTFSSSSSSSIVAVHHTFDWLSFNICFVFYIIYSLCITYIYNVYIIHIHIHIYLHSLNISYLLIITYIGLEMLFRLFLSQRKTAKLLWVCYCEHHYI